MKDLQMDYIPKEWCKYAGKQTGSQSAESGPPGWLLANDTSGSGGCWMDGRVCVLPRQAKASPAILKA